MRKAIPFLAILALIGVGVWWWLSQQSAQSAATLKGSGTIEAVETNVGPQVSGRVAQVMADEGQSVKAGQVLFQLDDSMLKAQRAQAEAAIQAARAQRDQTLAPARPEQLQAAQANLNSAQAALSSAQADLDQLLTGVTQAQIAAAQAQLKAAQAQAKILQISYTNVSNGRDLCHEYHISCGGLGQVEEKVGVQLNAANQQMAAAQTSLNTLLSGPTQDDVRVAEARVAAAEGQVQASQDQYNLLAAGPSREQVAAADAAVGQTAKVTVDSYSGVTFTATVIHIANQAEFTPRNVQTVEGRSTTVYAIELDVSNPDSRLKPGMPADVTFEELGNVAAK
jgi:HlyD family secretion protein